MDKIDNLNFKAAGFKSQKEFDNFGEDIIISLIETAIKYGDLSVDDFKTKKINDLLDFIKKYNNDITNDLGDLKHTIIYLDELLSEANILKDKRLFRLALIVYAMWIEHYFNEIIQHSLLSKDFSENEISNIMRLDIESKRTWLLPLLKLPRLSKKCTKNIKIIFDKRNEFMHYKWKGYYSDEMGNKDSEYESLCKVAFSTITCLKKYKTRNLITDKKIRVIFRSKYKQKNKV